MRREIWALSAEATRREFEINVCFILQRVPLKTSSWGHIFLLDVSPFPGSLLCHLRQ